MQMDHFQAPAVIAVGEERCEMIFLPLPPGISGHKALTVIPPHFAESDPPPFFYFATYQWKGYDAVYFVAKVDCERVPYSRTNIRETAFSAFIFKHAVSPLRLVIDVCIAWSRRPLTNAYHCDS